MRRLIRSKKKASKWYKSAKILYKNIIAFMLFDELKRFLGETETDNFTVSNNENTTFGFSLFETTFFSSFLWILGSKSCPKSLNVVYMSEITTTTLTFRNRTADITYCAEVMLFLHTMSGWLSLTRHFVCNDFLRYIALNAIWTHSLGAKLHFYPILYPLNMLNKTNLMWNG